MCTHSPLTRSPIPPSSLPIYFRVLSFTGYIITVDIKGRPVVVDMVKPALLDYANLQPEHPCNHYRLHVFLGDKRTKFVNRPSITAAQSPISSCLFGALLDMTAGMGPARLDCPS